MTFYIDKEGHYRLKLNREQLKRRRMYIRAGIPVVIRSIEEDTLMKLCEAKNEELFDDLCCQYCDADPWLPVLRKIARTFGVKHWRLKEEPKPWRLE